MDRYELTPHALLEEAFPGYLIYGRWDWVFGCWLALSRTGPLRPIVPTWPLLASDGSAACAHPILSMRDFWEPTDKASGTKHVAPASDDQIRNLAPQVIPAAMAALHSYLALIPTPLRSLIAPLGRYQWLLLDAVHNVPGYEDFARREAETRRMGFMIAVWSVAAAHRLNPCQRRALNRRIMSEPRRQLIEAVLGRSFAPSALSAIYKFDPAVINTKLIFWTMKALADDTARRRIALTRKLSPAFLTILNRIPEWMAMPNVLTALSELASDEDAIADQLVPESLVRLHPSQVEAAVRIIKTVKSGSELSEAIYKIEQRTLERAPFPSPPIRRHGQLVALQNSRDLKREARAMRNCVASYTPAIMTGGCFLCSWQGAERGTVELVRDGRGGWTLGSLAGHQNAPLSISTVRAIVEAVSAALSRPPADPLPGHRNATSAPHVPFSACEPSSQARLPATDRAIEPAARPRRLPAP